VPSTDGRGALQDPDQKIFWNENSFFEQYMDRAGEYRFQVESVVTTAHTDRGICWVQARLRAVAM